MKDKLLRTLWFAFMGAILLILASCVSSSGQFARLVPDNEVKQNFEAFNVIPGYSYYYMGTSSFPRAIVGISPDYKLDSSLWEPVELTSDDLHSWIWVHANRKPGDMQRYGSNIIGPDGDHIGVWYSLEDWQQWARIELDGTNSLKIGVPINRSRGARFGDDLRL